MLTIADITASCSRSLFTQLCRCRDERLPSRQIVAVSLWSTLATNFWGVPPSKRSEALDACERSRDCPRVGTARTEGGEAGGRYAIVVGATAGSSTESLTARIKWPVALFSVAPCCTASGWAPPPRTSATWPSPRRAEGPSAMGRAVQVR